MTPLAALVLCGLALLVGIWLAPRTPKLPGPGAAALLFLPVLLALLCSPALAQPAADKGSAKPAEPAATTGTTSTEAGGLAGDAGRFFWRSSTISGTTFMPGQDRKLLFGARLSGGIALPFRCALLGRLDASALSDGGALTVSLDDPQSFSTLEGTGVLTRELRGGISAAVAYGYTVPIDNGKAAILERYPRQFLLGFSVLTPDMFGIIGVGYHEASGPGTRLLFAGQKRVAGRTSMGLDGAVGTHSLVRAYVLVQVAGSER